MEKKELESLTVNTLTPQGDFSSVNFLQSKKFVRPSFIKSGMYAYADGLIYPEFIPEAQLQSVIGYVSQGKILGWCLKSVNRCWLETPKQMIIRRLVDYPAVGGKLATMQIINESMKRGCIAPAAIYCYAYSQDGVEFGTAFMPSKEDAILLYSEMNNVSKAFQHAGLGKIESELWVSSEVDYYAFTFSPYSLTYQVVFERSDKRYKKWTRPVLDLSHLR